MACPCEGHPPSSHARLNICLRQALNYLTNVDTLQMEQKDCLQNVFLGRGLIAVLPTGLEIA